MYKNHIVIKMIWFYWTINWWLSIFNYNRYQW